jgi:hypothetical protein
MWMKYLFLLALLGLSTVTQAQEVQHSIALRPWQAGMGNHRAVLQIEAPANAVRFRVTWRLHDQLPDKKRFLIVNAKTGDTIQNIYRVNVNDQQCDIVFGPVTKLGKYYFYYMPFKPDSGAGYYRFGYLPPEQPDKEWVNHNRISDINTLSKLPTVPCKALEARTPFDSFYPMEITPTPDELRLFLSKHQNDYLLFPEDRKFAIRMKDDIPLKWIKDGPQRKFKGIADRNEYYTFQIGLYAVRHDIDSIQVNFSDLKGPQTIPSIKLTCFNTGGIDSHGKPFTKRIDVAKGKVQALWMGVDIPSNIQPGLYNGSVTVSALGKKPETISLQLQITNKYLANRGDSEPWRYSRLRWLNSTAGISDKPTAPFTAIKFDGESGFSLYGKNITMAPNAMPASISTWGSDILAAPIQYVATGEEFSRPEITMPSHNAGKISETWTSASADFTLRGDASLEFDGYLHYAIHLKALHDVNLENFKLEIPFKKEIAQYMMGMGLPGTTVPDSLDAKWKGPHDSFWIGNTNGGLYCELLGSSYHGPLLNLYHPKPPASWYNDNKGGFSIRQNSRAVIATVYSGERPLKKGEEVNFAFDFIITPIKKLNTHSQFTDRYYHNGSNPWPDSSAVAAGIKVINIHQGNSYNPFINYPLLASKKIKYFADYWHNKGMKVKIYYTIRELTNHTPELWALLSLNNEILSKGKGGGYPWLREHVVNDYTPAWYTPIGNDIGNVDAALETAPGESRWYNFYVRSFAWLIKNEDIDGVYLDDVSFDRHIIKRVREVIDSVKPGCLIDLHSNTGFSKGPATQYTAFFPYINKLWFGESFQYNKMPPANWLVECSGIPFGLMGDMLQGGGNPWRGMIYGMTTRLPWSTEGVTCDPSEIWKIWDSFGIADANMIGYWNEHPVVRTTDPTVLATAYVKKGKTLISIASWAPNPVKIKLSIDWKALKLDPAKVKLIAPKVEKFQPAQTFQPEDSIPVSPEKGWLLIVR